VGAVVLLSGLVRTRVANLRNPAITPNKVCCSKVALGTVHLTSMLRRNPAFQRSVDVRTSSNASKNYKITFVFRGSSRHVM